MAFKDALRNLRKEDGMSQGDLAEKLGVGRSTISMWENGQREPALEMLESIADFFNVPMSRIVDKSPAPDGDEAGKIMEFIYSLPKERLRGILVALGAPADVLAELDQQ